LNVVAKSMDSALKLILSPIQRKNDIHINTLDEFVDSLIPKAYYSCHPLVCRSIECVGNTVCENCSRERRFKTYFKLNTIYDRNDVIYFVNIGEDGPTLYKAYKYDGKYTYDTVDIEDLPVCWCKHDMDVWIFGNGSIFKTLAVDTGKMRFFNDGNPVDRNELFFGNVSKIYLLNEGLFDNVNDTMFVDNWRNKPIVECWNIF